MLIEKVTWFRITRNAEVELDELDAEDLLDHIESELRERQLAKVVDSSMDLALIPGF